MTKLIATVVSVHAGANDDMSKEEHTSIEVELDGIVGDAHRSYSRKAWAGDKQVEGTVRRNERQWSAVSIEELAEIRESMDRFMEVHDRFQAYLKDPLLLEQHPLKIKNVGFIIT